MLMRGEWWELQQRVWGAVVGGEAGAPQKGLWLHPPAWLGRGAAASPGTGSGTGTMEYPWVSSPPSRGVPVGFPGQSSNPVTLGNQTGLVCAGSSEWDPSPAGSPEQPPLVPSSRIPGSGCSAGAWSRGGRWVSCGSPRAGVSGWEGSSEARGRAGGGFPVLRTAKRGPSLARAALALC